MRACPSSALDSGFAECALISEVGLLTRYRQEARDGHRRRLSTQAWPFPFFRDPGTHGTSRRGSSPGRPLLRYAISASSDITLQEDTYRFLSS